MTNVEGTTIVNSRTKTIETRKIKIESTTGATRIITTGMTTKIAPGGSTRRNTTGILVNSRRRITKSSRSTGIGAMLIRIRTSQVTTSNAEANQQQICPVRNVTDG